MGLNFPPSTTFALMSFAAPLMALGILGIAAPILAHAMFKRTKKRVEFPTIDLLKEARAGQSQLFRLRKWIMLSLRCLAIFLIACTFTQPIWEAVHTQAGPGQKAIVILIDTSGSTQAQQSGASSFKELRALADRYLDQLQLGKDRVIAIAVGSRPQLLLNDPTTNLDLIREQIRKLQPSDQSADFPAAFAEAAAQLKNLGSEGQLVVISDFQKSDWERLNADTLKSEVWASTEILLMAPPTQQTENLAILEARMTPHQARINQTANASVMLANYGESTQEVSLEVRINGVNVTQLQTSLAPNSTKTLRTPLFFEETGDHLVSFHLPADALTLDNHFTIKVPAISRIPVLYLSDESMNQQKSASFFITRALMPFGSARDDFNVIPFSSLDLDTRVPPKASAWIISDSAVMTERAMDRLANYLLEGGGVLWITGEDASKENLNLLEKRLAIQLKQPDQALLPWLPTQYLRLDLKGDNRRISSGAWNSAWLRAFDPATQQALNQVRFTRLWQSTVRRDIGQALLSYDDQSPALSLVDLGKGRLLMANFNPSLNDSDLAKHGSFVALMFELVQQLYQQQEEQVIHVGDLLNLNIKTERDSSGNLQVLNPAGQPLAFDHELNKDTLMISLTDADQVGLYQVMVNGQTLDQIPVQAWPRESDLDHFSTEVLGQNLSQAGASKVQDAQGVLTRGDQEGTPLWPFLLVAGLVVIGLETLLVGIYPK